MEVIRYPGTRSFPEIETEVQAVRAVDKPKNCFGPLGEVHHLVSRWSWKLYQGIQVQVRNNQDVTRRVRESVQADEAVLRTMDNQSSPISHFKGHTPLYGVVRTSD